MGCDSEIMLRLNAPPRAVSFTLRGLGFKQFGCCFPSRVLQHYRLLIRHHDYDRHAHLAQ